MVYFVFYEVIEEKQDENDGKKPTQEDATEKSEN